MKKEVQMNLCCWNDDGDDDSDDICWLQFFFDKKNWQLCLYDFFLVYEQGLSKSVSKEYKKYK